MAETKPLPKTSEEMCKHVFDQRMERVLAMITKRAQHGNTSFTTWDVHSHRSLQEFRDLDVKEVRDSLQSLGYKVETLTEEYEGQDLETTTQSVKKRTWYGRSYFVDETVTKQIKVMRTRTYYKVSWCCNKETK